MKKLLLSVLACLFIFCSCDSSGSGVDGLWSDIIKFDTKQANFDANGGTKKITSKGHWWWILDYISVGEESVYFPISSEIKVETGKMAGLNNSNVVYDEGADIEIKRIEGSWFVVTKDTSNSLIIETKPNTTDSSRSFILHIEAGDYFDYITIYQSAK